MVLPNIKSCTQEKDQQYQELGGKFIAMTNEVFTSKIIERIQGIKAIKEDLQVLGFQEDWDKCDDTIVTPQMKFLLLKLKDKMRTPRLTNDDLLSILNVFPGTTPLQSPLVSTFTKDKIIKCFSCVGYAPFTRNYLMNPYIYHRLGEEGDDTFLQHLVQVYEESKIDLLNQGFHVEGVFDDEIPTATKLRRKEAEEDQVQALVKSRGDFSASLIYKNVGTMCITPSAILTAQMIQLEQEAKEMRKKSPEEDRCAD